ncbi:hypothetical protein [Cellulosimicrobium cellulans]|uniref:hypothetical protein n=1 Tax=Cellulosimicrobium cellulans TaxID=1710 RepID=UPI0005BD24EA|nr:hypothetical protein [Cellulosimicrobium cellulans]
MVAVGAAGWAYVAVNVLDWAPASWLRLDRNIRDASWVPALVAALCAGYFGRWVSPSSAMFSPAAGRGLERLTGALIRSLALVIGAVSLGSVAILALIVAARGADGIGAVLSTVSHVAGVIAAVPLGFVLARVSPARTWPLVTLAGTALVLFLPLLVTDTLMVDTGRSLLSVSLSWGIAAPDTGWTVPATIALLRMGYFALLALACALLAGAVVRRGSTRDKVRALAPAAMPVGLLAVIALGSPNLHLVTPTPVEMVCGEPTEKTRVCVADDDHALLPDISRTVETLASVAPPTSPVLVSSPTGSAGSDPSTILLPEIANATTRSGFDRQVARETSLALLSPGDCDALEDADVPAEYWRGVLSKMLTTVGVPPEQTGIVEDSGAPVYGNGYDRLAPLSTPDFADWLTQHLDQVRDCSLTEDQLP